MPDPITHAAQAAAWAGTIDGDLLLVRRYDDGTVTAERQIAGVYTGEITLTPEPVSS